MTKHASDQPRSRWKLLRPNQVVSIKRRVIRVALIPDTALILLWVLAFLYLGGTGFYDQKVASSVREVSIPAVTGLSSVETESQLSQAYLANRQSGLQRLLSQQKQTDRGLSAMRAAAGDALAHAPQSIVTRMDTLVGYIDQLPDVRGRVDAGIATTSEVATFYGQLLDAATDLFGDQARVVPDASVVPGAIAATAVFHITDLAARAGSLISGALAAGRLDEADYLEFANLVGAYHALLSTTAPDLRPDVQISYRTLTGTAAWRGLVAAEDAIIVRGPWSGGVPPDLPVTAVSWQSLTGRVNTALTDMTITQADQVSAQALSDGNHQLIELGIVLAAALVVVVGSIWWARRQSTQLVDSALVTRLGHLRQDAQDLVGTQLPAIVERLRAGEAVDIEDELGKLRYGAGNGDGEAIEGDEIDQVAVAINDVLRQAATSAAGEAQSRNAFRVAFQGIARRNLRPLSQLLALLDKLEHSEQDPESLKRLYDLDHEATRARRGAENLIILSGGSLHQHLPGPIRILAILRSAISETSDYRRVKLTAVPDVAIARDAVKVVIHLLAELLDNAATFSRSHEVRVSSRQVPSGIIIEVDDCGVGINPERMQQVNEMLANPPEEDVTAIGDGSQLGFWVIASLIRRFRFRVQLQDSPYGGVQAVVLVPNKLLAGTSALPDGAAIKGVGGAHWGARALPAAAPSDLHEPPTDADPEATSQMPPIDTPEAAAVGSPTAADALPRRQPGIQTGRNPHGSTTQAGPASPIALADGGTSGRNWPPAESQRRDPAHAPSGPDVVAPSGTPRWPTAHEANEQASGTLPALPRRSPGTQLHDSLREQPAGEQRIGSERDASGSMAPVGSQLSAFQRGSVAGRSAGANHEVFPRTRAGEDG